jgi:hypothetical protein
MNRPLLLFCLAVMSALWCGCAVTTKDSEVMIDTSTQTKEHVRPDPAEHPPIPPVQ